MPPLLQVLGDVLNGTVNNPAGDESNPFLRLLPIRLSSLSQSWLTWLLFSRQSSIILSAQILMHSRAGEFASEESGALGHVLVSGA
jgi:hypothetical protein